MFVFSFLFVVYFVHRFSHFAYICIHEGLIFQTILQHLLELQSRADRLCERSKLVVPVHQRKVSQEAGTVKAQALVSYRHRQVWRIIIIVLA